MVDPDKLAYAKLYLGRTKTLVQLKTLADQVAAALLNGETRVTITQQTFEGGQTQGATEFEAAVVGLACEHLIRELDSTAAINVPGPRAMGSLVFFA